MSIDKINSIAAQQVADLASAGMAVPVDPDQADMMAAFIDDALSPEDALASRFDDEAGDDLVEGGE